MLGVTATNAPRWLGFSPGLPQACCKMRPTGFTYPSVGVRAKNGPGALHDRRAAATGRAFLRIALGRSRQRCTIERPPDLHETRRDRPVRPGEIRKAVTAAAQSCAGQVFAV